MVKFFVLFVAVFCSVFFINYKYSQTVRIFAYNEEEQKGEATFALIIMVIASIAWSAYFSFF